MPYPLTLIEADPVQIEDTAYKLSRFFFQRDSAIFKAVFVQPSGPGAVAQELQTIRLIGVKVVDFDRFLSILFREYVIRM